VTYWAQRSGAAVLSLVNLPLGIRSANALLSYFRYIGKAFWPTGLAVFYPLDANMSLGAAIVAGVGLVGVTAVVVWRARRAPWLVTGWFWYVGTLVPVIGLVQVGSQSMADRYTYIPLVGLFIMLCWSVPQGMTKQPMVELIACVVAGATLAVYGALARVQVGYWKDTETLFRHALRVTRNNWQAEFCLGVALQGTGRTQEEMAHYEEALRINPGLADAHNNLGNVLFERGRVSEAMEQFEQALRLNPELPETHYNVGVALEQMGRMTEAMEHWEQAVRIKPDYVEALNSLGVALCRTGRTQEGMRRWEEALRIRPDYAEAHYNLAFSLEQAGRIQEAIGHYEQALRLKPDFVKAQSALTRLQRGR